MPGSRHSATRCPIKRSAITRNVDQRVNPERNAIAGTGMSTSFPHAAVTGLRPALSGVALVIFGLGALGLSPAARAADRRIYQISATVGVGSFDRETDGNLSGGIFVAARLLALPIADGWPLHVEVGTQQFGNTTQVVFTDSGQVRGQVEVETKSSATYVAARVNAPLNDGLSLYGKLGLSLNAIDVAARPSGAAFDDDRSRLGVLGALGVTYDFRGGLTLSGEAVNYGRSPSPSGSTASAVNVAIGYRF